MSAVVVALLLGAAPAEPTETHLVVVGSLVGGYAYIGSSGAFGPGLAVEVGAAFDRFLLTASLQAWGTVVFSNQVQGGLNATWAVLRQLAIGVGARVGSVFKPFARSDFGGPNALLTSALARVMWTPARSLERQEGFTLGLELGPALSLAPQAALGGSVMLAIGYGVW